MWPCVPDQFGSYLEMSLLDQEGKPEFPEKNLSEQRREPTTNRSAQIWRGIRESNPGHTSGRRVLWSLRQPCYFATSTRPTFFVPQYWMPLKKSEKMVMQNFGRQTKYIMGHVEVVMIKLKLQSDSMYSLCAIIGESRDQQVKLSRSKKNNSSQRELWPPVFQCDSFVQICLLLVPPSFWSRNDTKLPKPWNMSLILSNL